MHAGQKLLRKNKKEEFLMKTLTLILKTVTSHHINLFTFSIVVILSDKPTSNKQSYGQDPESTEKELSELKKKLETLTSIPKKKYPFPMTQN